MQLAPALMRLRKQQTHFVCRGVEGNRRWE